MYDNWDDLDMVMNAFLIKYINISHHTTIKLIPENWKNNTQNTGEWLKISSFILNNIFIASSHH